MKEWFKARNVWGGAILALEDDEAGRLVKALWGYTMTGEPQMLAGAEKAVFAMIMLQLAEDERRDAEISSVRAVAGAKGGKQTQAKQAIASTVKQPQANASNCYNKNKNKEQEQETEQEPETELTVDVANRIANEHNRVLNAAEDAGFQRTNTVRARLIDLYAEHGLDKVLQGIESCAIHGVANIAYLQGVLSGKPKKASNNPATAYEQRDYTGVQEESVARMMAWNPEADEA